MKKVLVSLVALILVLSGCSGSGEQSKVCTINEGGQEMKVKATSDGDLVKEVEVEMTVKVPNAENYSDEEKEEIKDALSQQYGNEEGIKIDFDFNGDELTLVMTVDAQKVGDNFKAPGVDSKEKLNKMKYDDFVKYMESNGECK